jgi:predicted nucleotidyltransferase
MTITDEMRDKVAELARKHGLFLVVLFGSQATGYTHKHSDIDIGYVSNRDIDYKENYNVSLELARVFNHKDVEFTNIYKVSPSMKKQISQTGIPLYEKDSAVFDYFKIHALREYLDTKPLRIYRDSLVNDFIKTHA